MVFTPTFGQCHPFSLSLSFGMSTQHYNPSRASTIEMARDELWIRKFSMYHQRLTLSKPLVTSAVHIIHYQHMNLRQHIMRRQWHNMRNYNPCRLTYFVDDTWQFSWTQDVLPIAHVFVMISHIWCGIGLLANESSLYPHVKCLWFTPTFGYCQLSHHVFQCI